MPTRTDAPWERFPRSALTRGSPRPDHSWRTLLAQESITKVELLEYPELGMEAVYKIEVKDFPAFILVDNKGNEFFSQLPVLS